jgi:hypothetical protein
MLFSTAVRDSRSTAAVREQTNTDGGDPIVGVVARYFGADDDGGGCAHFGSE